MKAVRVVVGAVTILILGLGVVAVRKYSEAQKQLQMELLREREARETQELKARLLAFEAENARREKAAAETARHRLELDSERQEARRLTERKIRESGRARDEASAEQARQKELRRRSQEAERQQQMRDLEARRAVSPWGKLQKGMTRNQVRQILGEPKWTEGGISGESWMYLEHTTLGCGSVSFEGGVVETFRDPFRCQTWQGWPTEWPGLDAEAKEAMERARDDQSGAPSYPIGTGPTGIGPR
jgi:hypothetical protein